MLLLRDFRAETLSGEKRRKNLIQRILLLALFDSEIKNWDISLVTKLARTFSQA